MKKYIILWVSILAILGKTVSAQQIPISTIFVENPFAFNPAVAGSDKCFKLRLDQRLQWLGFSDAPSTTLLSGYGPHKFRNIGYGGTIVSDKTGPTSSLKASAAFASNFAIDGDIRVSLALSLGVLQYKADGTQFDFGDDVEDQRAPHAVMSSFLPDAGTGVFVYHYDWYFGLSAQQLINNNVKFSNASGEDKKINRLKTHLYGFAGYRFTMVNKFVIEPAVLVRPVISGPLQIDLSGRVFYQESFWGGISIRNTFQSFDDMSLIFGYIHERRICVSIAYDYSFAKIAKFTAGTIELVLGYNFDEIRKGR